MLSYYKLSYKDFVKDIYILLSIHTDIDKIINTRGSYLSTFR